MFDLGDVELFNFRSFKGRHRISLPRGPGLYLITGDNQAEPRLEANGVGKSTIFDAVYWCLYGTTTRGLRAGDVISYDEKSASVLVKLQVNSDALEIKRTQSPNSLTLNGKPVSQGDLEKHLSLGPEAFTYAVLLPQFGESFFDLRPEPKLKVFTEIMELDFWLEKAKVAEGLAAEIEAASNGLTRDAAKLQGQVELIAADIHQLEGDSINFARDQKRRMNELKHQIMHLNLERTNVLEGIQFAEKALKNVERKQAGAGSKAKICPTCRQPIKDADYEALQQNHSDFERQIQRLTRQQDAQTVEIEYAEKALKQEQSRVNHYAEAIAKAEDKRKAAKGRLKVIADEIDALNEDFAAASYWISGFKRVRLFLVEHTLRKLEIEVNNAAVSLGLTDWRIEFDVERENKSGGVTKGFTVLVYPPGRKEPVRFEAYSGGETQRLRLAGDLGLANLIMERAGLRSMLEVYDEPASFLSAGGLVDVAETLHTRALTTNKRIFLIDHATIDFGEFTGRLCVVKDHIGSHLL